MNVRHILAILNFQNFMYLGMWDFFEKFDPNLVTLTFDLQSWSSWESCLASNVEYFGYQIFVFTTNRVQVTNRQKYHLFQKSRILNPCKMGNFWNFHLIF